MSAQQHTGAARHPPWHSPAADLAQLMIPHETSCSGDLTRLLLPTCTCPPRRLVCSILADSWREEADLGHVVWALGQLFHEALLARLPLPHPPAFFL